MTMVGRTYLERGLPVVVLAQWHAHTGNLVEDGTLGLTKDPAGLGLKLEFHTTARSGSCNVLIRRANGELVIRPTRGLRKVPD